MQLREILNKALDIIGDQAIDLEQDSPKTKRLIASANTIYHELASEYIDLKTSEELEFVDNKLYYLAFSKKVKDILSINKNGRSIDFKLYPMYIQAETTGIAQINYNYHPEEIDIDSVLELPPQYTSYTLANGVASEYFYRSGLFDEAIFYKNRYDTAILNLSRRKRSIRLKAVGRFI